MPPVSPAFLQIVAAPNAVADASARDLYAAIGRALRAIAAPNPLVEHAVACGGHPGEASHRRAQAHDAPEWRKLLIMVADVDASPFPLPPELLVTSWLGGGASYVVLPMLQQGLHFDHYFADDARFPDLAALRRLNVSWWTHTPAENVDEVLALADLGAEERRVFVSYRRPDTLNIAEQLFETLEKNRFDVFVDRFRVPPGRNFQERLTDELAHKSMVLVLESPTIFDSSWVAYELNFAKERNLGHLAVHLPGGPTLPWLDEAYRVRIADDELTMADGAPTADRTVAAHHRLGPVALGRVVAALVAEHGRALIRRRGVMLDTLRASLLRFANVAQAIDVGGRLRITATRPDPGGGDDVRWADPACAERRYVVWASPRPPDVEDFRVAHGVCTPGPDPAGAIFTVAAFGESRRRSQTAWLAERSLVRLYDEGGLAMLASSIARGGDLP